VADEKHSWWLGNRVYIATTAAQGCFLGAALTPTADTEGLTKAYGVFATEAQALQPGYCPETVNTDGWEQTQSAWKRECSEFCVRGKRLVSKATWK
jgi:hypothetical protein